VQIFYHVGSKDEHVGNRGVAHMFEHLMFKGSTHVPPEDHARLLKDVGGQVNAFTTEDVTAFHQTVPPSTVDFAIKLEAERMRGLRLFAATVDSERKVVEEEKRLRIDNNPIGQAIERFRALAYTVHPYSWTAAGTLEDLERVRRQDCQAFYDTYYRPNNATLIVVGDVGGGETVGGDALCSADAWARASPRHSAGATTNSGAHGHPVAGGQFAGLGGRLPHPAREPPGCTGARGVGVHSVGR
jgi:zinc protease